MLRARLEEARPLLLASLPWSPFDFAKGVSDAGDRAVLVEPLLREIAEADDLRFTCSIAGGTEVAVCAERLPWDSQFFGYDVAKLHGIFPLTGGGYSRHADYTPAIGALIRLAKSRGIRYLFAVVDARDLPAWRGLAALGFAPIETRLRMHCSLRDYEFHRRFRTRLATPADLESLTELAQSIENPYDRFSADPFIPREDVVRLMGAWMRASLLHGFADAVVVSDAPRPTSLISVRYHRDNWAAWGTSIGQLTLALSLPQSGHWLVGVVSESNYHLKSIGARHGFLTTQITNRNAIRVVEHLGYRSVGGEHVMRLLL